MICVYNKNNTDFTKNGDAVLVPLSATLEMTINGTWQLKLSHPYDPEGRYKLLVEGNIIRADIKCIRELEATRQLFRIYYFMRDTSAVEVIAFPVAMEANFDAPIDNIVIENKTGIEAMAALQNKIGSGKYTLQTDITRTGSTSLANTNIHTALAGSGENSFLKVWGGELIYDNFKFKVRNRVGDNTAADHKIQYGNNLSNIEYKKDDSGVTTRIYPISQDGIRLNGSGYVDSPDHFSDYPVAHCRHLTAPYTLVDTNPSSPTSTAAKTRQAVAAVTAQAQTDINTGVTNATGAGIPPEYIKSIRQNITEAVKAAALSAVYSSSLYAALAAAVEAGAAGLAELEQPEWSWMGSDETGWKYGNANSYARNEYIKIGKKWSYFGDDGVWQEPRDDSAAWDWHQESGTLKRYGNFEKYYAHNEYIYITESGTLKEYWFNEQGWYESDESGDSDWAWHGSGTAADPWWFGEEGASASDTRKYAHDCWLFIDGTLYFFDSYGYYDGSTKFENYQWDWVKSDERFWFGNDEDHSFAAVYLRSQWAKINGAWYYFDANGYVETTNDSIERAVAYFTAAITGTTSTVNSWRDQLYTLLYNNMTAWALRKYSQERVDLPVITISVFTVDLSKTTEYKGFEHLQTIKLGDSVECTDAVHGISTTNRVVGIVYDIIKDYNEEVVIGSAAATVGQILGSGSGQAVAGGFDTSALEAQISATQTSLGTLQRTKQNKLTAGDNITIENDVISAAGGGGHGLEYWTETSESLYRAINEEIYDFSCDAQFLVENGVDITYTSNYYSPRKYTSSGKAMGALGHYYDGGSTPENGFVLFSTDPDAVKVLAELNGLSPNRNEAVAISYNGHTIYTNGQIYNAARDTTIVETSGLVDVGTFDSYSEFVNYVLNNSGLEIHTELLKQTGIGVGEKVVWGGKRYSSSDEYPFYATDNGLVYGNKHISKGIHDGISGDEGTVRVGQEIGNYVAGDGWTRCLVFRMKNTTAPYIMGVGEQAWDTMQIVIATTNQADLDFEWGYSNNTLTEPYGVEEWFDKDEYTGGYDTASVTYNGKTWYCLQIHPARKYNFGCSISGISKTFSATYNDDAATNGLKLLEACHAVDHIEVVTEIGTKTYAFKYGGDYKTYAYVDTDGNALFKEITTDAGTLTQQMAQKQNLLTAGSNIQINNNTISATDTTYEEFDGDDAGLVPAVETQSGKFLKDDGSWATPSGGGGGGSFIGLTKSQYDALPVSEKEDTSKLYFVQEGGGLPIIEDLIQAASDWSMYREGSMTINWANNTIVFDWLGGSNIGGNIVKIAPIPANATKIKFKITTGSSYSTTIDRFRVFIGVRTTYQTGVILPYYSVNDWLVKSDFYTQNAVWESELDLSGVTVDTYLYITAHGWDATVDYLKLETPSAATVTRHIYWNDAKWAQWKSNEITYGTAAPTEAGNNGDLFILLDNNNDKIGEYLFITNAWVQIE